MDIILLNINILDRSHGVCGYVCGVCGVYVCGMYTCMCVLIDLPADQLLLKILLPTVKDTFVRFVHSVFFRLPYC